MNTITRYIRKAFRARGFDMIHYASWQKMFEAFQIDLIFDVGANIGQTYDAFRWAGFNGPICSFEANPETFKILQTKAGISWQRFPYALSSQSGQLKFYVTNNDNECSFQRPFDGQYPVVNEITVPTWRLDEFWKKEGFKAKQVFLKVDTEGHDLEVIRGASGIFDRVPLIMAEVSALPRFQGEPPAHEFIETMANLGYRLCRVDKNAFNRAAGIDTALDMVFAKTDLLSKLNS